MTGATRDSSVWYIDLAVPDAIQEAIPLVLVIDQHPASGVTGHPQQHPSTAVVHRHHPSLDATGIAGPSPAGLAPGKAVQIDSQALDRRLRRHGVRQRPPGPGPTLPGARVRTILATETP